MDKLIDNPFFGDYHIHSEYSDSVTTIRQIVERAVSIGLKEVAITDHGFKNPSCLLSLTRKKLVKQQKEIEFLRKEFPEITILSGIEANLVSLDGSLDMEMEEFSQFDIVNFGFHSFSYPKTFFDLKNLYFPSYKNYIRKNYYPSKEVIKQNTKAYITAIEKYPVDVLTHINNFCKVDVFDVCKACFDNNTLVELNSKHIDVDLKDLDSILKSNVKIIANTDSHKLSQVGDFSKIIDFLNKNQISLNILENYNKKPSFKGKVKSNG